METGSYILICECAIFVKRETNILHYFTGAKITLKNPKAQAIKLSNIHVYF